jgi:hypothetical protein
MSLSQLSQLPFDVLEKLLQDINYPCQADEEKDKHLNQDLPNLGPTCRTFASLSRPLSITMPSLRSSMFPSSPLSPSISLAGPDVHKLQAR